MTPAPLLRRAAATGIDLALLALTTFIVLLVTGLLETADAYQGNALMIRTGIAVVIAWLLLNSWFLLRGAQSPGKRLLRLRLVDRRGLALPFWRCLLRPLIFLVPAMTPLWWLPLAGLLLAVMPDRRCLHDWVVDSRVIGLAAVTPEPQSDPAATAAAG